MSDGTTATTTTSFVPRSIRNTKSIVTNIVLRGATGRERSGKIVIRDDHGRITEHTWSARYQHDNLWSIEGDGAIGPENKRVTDVSDFPFLMDSAGNNGVKEILQSWLNSNAKTVALPSLDSSPVAKPEPVLDVPKPDPEPRPEKVEKAKSKTMKAIKNPTLQTLADAVCEICNITEKQLRDPQSREGVDGRKVFCNAATRKGKIDAVEVGAVFGWSPPTQVYQVRGEKDGSFGDNVELNTLLACVVTKMKDKVPDFGEATQVSADTIPNSSGKTAGGKRRKYKKRTKATAPAGSRAPAPGPVSLPALASVTTAGMNGEFNAIVYTVFELRGRNVQLVAKAFGITEAEVNGAVVAVMRTLGERFATVSTALSKCG